MVHGLPIPSESCKSAANIIDVGRLQPGGPPLFFFRNSPGYPALWARLAVINIIFWCSFDLQPYFYFGGEYSKSCYFPAPTVKETEMRSLFSLCHEVKRKNDICSQIGG